jgi:tRNA (guanine-N7-)-methyltransferase
MDIKPEYKKKPIRSYVIRSGRITDGQRLAFADWWPKYGLSLFAGPLDSMAVFGNDHPLALEVGFGMGDSLVAMAEAEPEVNFVGIEVHSPGVGRLISNAGRLGLTNLRVYMADANDVLNDCILDDSLQRFQLYFPDPWHKTKHHKRRIVQPEFVALIARKLHSGGLIHMATDWEGYARQMLTVLRANDALRNTAEHYAARPEFRPRTKFENRGERLGHGVWDLLFVKSSTDAG